MPSNANESGEQRGDDAVEAQQSPTATARYATFLLDLEDDRGNSISGSASEPVMTRKHLRHFNLVDNETVVMLYQIHGDLDQVRMSLEASPEVLNHDVVARGDGEAYAYVHCELDDPVKGIVKTLHEFEVVLDMPLEFTDDGSVRATLIGETPALDEALNAIADVVEMTLEKTGEYNPGMRTHDVTLTNRQRQILTVAVEEGYYEVPREVTLEEVAAEMDLSRATVGEHLQKIEGKILSRVVR
jgi:predicted DNA binding protein